MAKKDIDIWEIYEEIVSAIDSGKFSTKLYNGRKVDIFRTSMKRLDSYDPTQTGAFMEYQNEMFQVGFENGRVDTDKSKKKLVHRLCIFYALSRMKIKPNQAIKLTVGCPSDLCKNQVEREQYAEYIKGEGKIEVSINKKEYKFNITDVLVLPESSGIIFREENYDEYSEEMIGIIDIGGLNAQGTIYVECNPLHDSIFALNNGTDNLYTEIKTRLNSMEKDGRVNNYTDDQINYKIKYLDDKSKNLLSDEEINAIKEIMKHHLLDKIFKEMASKGWNIQGMKLIFTGGGSLLMKSVIEELGYKVSADPLYDNVRGFYEVGVQYYGE